MNEIPPPSEPNLPAPTPAPVPPLYPDEVPSRKFCAFLGLLLLVVTGALTPIIPPICLLGLVVAIGSLFFKGYRYIFVGYIVPLGVLLLGTIIYCSNHPLEIR